ncbi:glycosyltransferase family 2 protein [Candidatus Pacearchaeota archaeon]|nr:glycosyltransferase family 2 protein [Candidatus Pacearchaeota archaeon]
MRLSILIPVYNEEKTILAVLERIKKVDLGLAKEIIIVNDGSKDNSEEIIRSFLKKNKSSKGTSWKFYSKENGGKGSAIKMALSHATGDLSIIQDADLEYLPEEIETLIAEYNKRKSEVVYGSRILKRDNKASYILYYLGNVFLSFMTSILYGRVITDMETCYKLIPTKIFRELKITRNNFDLEPEITAKILRKGYNIKEIPITYNPRSKTEGKKISWRDGFSALWVLFKIRISRA